MKRFIYITILIMSSAIALAKNEEIASILRDGGFPFSEQKVILAILDDAMEKGLVLDDLISVLKENHLKKSSYFETVEDLISRVKIQFVVKESQFPFWYDANIRKIGYYLAQFYTFNQFGQIVTELKEKDFKKQDVENIFQMILFLNSSGVVQNDSFTLIYLLLRNKEIDPGGLNAIKRIILRSRDLNLSQNQVIFEINKQLMKRVPLKKIINDIEKNIQTK